jgi:hypothetical protein
MTMVASPQDSGSDSISFRQFCSSARNNLKSDLCKVADTRSKTHIIIEATRRILECLAKQNGPLQELNNVIVWRKANQIRFCGLFDRDLVAHESPAARVFFKPGLRLFNPEIKQHRQQLQMELSRRNLIQGDVSPTSQILHILEALEMQRLDQDFAAPSGLLLVNKSGFTKKQLKTAIRRTKKFLEKNKFGAIAYHTITEDPAIIYLLDPGICDRLPAEGSTVLPSGLLQTHICFQEDPLVNLRGMWYKLLVGPRLSNATFSMDKS